MKLTIKQERLVDEYVKTGNAYQAAINAGYSKSYARVDVHKILAKPSVKQAIENRLAQLKKRVSLTRTKFYNTSRQSCEVKALSKFCVM